MAIQLLSFPLRPPVRSPAYLVAKDLGFQLSTGAVAEWSITFTSAAAVDDTLRIMYADVDVLMRCLTAMADDGTSFGASPSNVGAATAFLNGALANYFFYRDFIITRASNVVTFKARRPGADYNPVILQPGGALTITTATAVNGADVLYRTGHYVGMAVQVETTDGSGDFQRLPDMAVHAGTDSIVQADLSTWLAPLLKPDIRPFAFLSPLPCTESTRRFNVLYWARYADAAGGQPERAVAVTSTARAWLAGHERAEYGRFNAWMNGVPYAPYRFLTWRGRTVRREVTKAERHYLNWLYARNLTIEEGQSPVVQMQVRYHLADASDSAWITSAVTMPLPAKGTFHTWPVGWDAVSLDALAADAGVDPDKAVAYSIRLFATDINVVLTEEYRFELVEPDYQDVHIQWFSSLGAWESVRMGGAWQRNTTPSFQELRHVLRHADQGTDVAANTTFPLGAQDTITLHSQVNPILEHRALLDILQSPAVRLVDLANGRFIPLRITEGEETPVDGKGGDDENMHQLKVTFRLDDDNPAHTALP